MFTRHTITRATQKYWYLLLVVAFILIAMGANTVTINAQKPTDPMVIAPENVWWNVSNPNGFVLKIYGPNDFAIEQKFDAGEYPSFKLVDGAAEGLYSYELWPEQVPARQVFSAESRGLATDGANSPAASGFFSVNGGKFVTRSNENGATGINAIAAQVFLTDVIVQGSECIGLDCANGESFGFDTLRLKENNLRIHFYDTSTSASFPSNDWRITINDSSNGGANYFGIDDATSNRRIFMLKAGAPANSLVVGNYGDVGIGTNNPVVKLHTVDGDTPTVRLEQNGSFGWTPQTWDVAGNETNFFIRDVTNGAKLPFKIIPNAPNDSLVIENNGNIGLGERHPTAELQMPLDTTSFGTGSKFAVGDGNTAVNIETNGKNAKFFLNRTDGALGAFVSSASAFAFGTGNSNRVMLLVNNSPKATFNTDSSIDTATGATLTAGGVWTDNSDRNLKMNFTAVDGQSVLAKLAGVPITTWSYKVEGESVVHMGPMAQDFYAAFGLGNDDKHIAALDTNGVALAAAQELYALTQTQQTEIDALTQQNAELQARLDLLEASLNKILQSGGSASTVTPVMPVPK